MKNGKLQKQQMELANIKLLADKLIYSECSTTSKHFRFWSNTSNTAEFLHNVLASGGTDSFLDTWVPEVLQTLQQHLRGESD